MIHHGVTEQTYYRWRKEYGGMRVEQAKRLKDLEKKNIRLKKLVADIIALATQYGRYGYRRITAMLNSSDKGRSLKVFLNIVIV